MIIKESKHNWRQSSDHGGPENRTIRRQLRLWKSRWERSCWLVDFDFGLLTCSWWAWWTYFRKEGKQCFTTIAWKHSFHKTFINCCLLSVFIVYSQLDRSSWEEETKINSMNIMVASANFRKPHIWCRNNKFIIVWY